MTTTDFLDPYGSTWRFDPAPGQWSRWDGSAWVTGGRTPPGYGQPAPPPSSCQPTAAVRPRRPVWPWVLGSIGVGVVVVIVLVVVLAVVVVHRAVHDLTRAEAAHSITQEQYNAAKLGTSEHVLETQLGKASFSGTTTSFALPTVP
jgi:hypothetical protein